MQASIDDDAIVPLVRNIRNINYSDIPIEAREVSKKCVLDTLGVTVAGSTAPGCASVVEMVRGWGGRPECTLVAYGDRLPSPSAIWANATMARARDYDSYDDITAEHTNVATVTTALATAELMGIVDGQKIITAIALGDDLSIRIRSGLKTKAGISAWSTSAYSVFPSAAVAGKLLGLSEDELISAMGLAFTQFSNTLQGHQEGALSVRLHHGLGVRAGLLSALMAQKGITGPRHVLEGKFGLYPVYGQNEYDRDTVLDGLGQRFLNTRISIKPWPCCGASYAVVDGTLQLVRDFDIRPQDVEEVIAHVDQTAYAFTCEPVEEKRVPRSIPAAQFSIPYNVGVAVVYRNLTLSNYTDTAIRDERVLEIASKVKPIIDPSLTAVPAACAPARVEIRTKTGHYGPLTVQAVKGQPGNPMSMDECVAKFRTCVALSFKPLPEENTEEVIDSIKKLEDLPNFGDLVKLLA